MDFDSIDNLNIDQIQKEYNELIENSNIINYSIWEVFCYTYGQHGYTKCTYDGTVNGCHPSWPVGTGFTCSSASSSNDCVSQNVCSGNSPFKQYVVYCSNR